MDAIDGTEDHQASSLVRGALEAFGMHDARWSVLASGHNHVFKLETPDHGELVLRILNPALSDDAVASQLYWLEHLAGAPGVRVPRPVPLLNGAPTAFLTRGPGAGRRCVLLRWLEGEPVRRPTVEWFARAGEAAGHMHAASIRMVLPSWFRCRTFDTGQLFGERSCLHNPAAAPLLGAAGRTLVEETRRQFDELQAELGQSPETFGLVHGDLNLRN